MSVTRSTEAAVLPVNHLRVDWDSARGDAEKSALVPDVFTDGLGKKDHLIKIVTTAKPHWCQRCQVSFPAPTRMRFDSYFVVGNGRRHSNYTCFACCTAMDRA